METTIYLFIYINASNSLMLMINYLTKKIQKSLSVSW